MFTTTTIMFQTHDDVLYPNFRILNFIHTQVIHFLLNNDAIIGWHQTPGVRKRGSVSQCCRDTYWLYFGQDTHICQAAIGLLKLHVPTISRILLFHLNIKVIKVSIEATDNSSDFFLLCLTQWWVSCVNERK